MIIMITNDAARWSPDIAGPQTAYRLDRHLERRQGFGFIECEIVRADEGLLVLSACCVEGI